MIKNKKILKSIAAFFTLLMIESIVMPTATYALTSGPNSEEFSSYEPVATTDMVNVFSGDMTYNLPVVNIPGPDGSGYSMSLSYHSGVSSEEEASWVGHGWTLNPGAINRAKQGYPDDFKEANVTQYNKTIPNWSSSVNYSMNFELASKDLYGSLGVNKTIRYNNYRGFNSSTGYGFSYKGMAGLNLQRSGGETTADISINPMAILASFVLKGKDYIQKEKGTVSDLIGNIKDGIDNIQGTKIASDNKALNSQIKAMMAGSNFTASSMVGSSSPLSVSSFNGIGYNWSKSVQATIVSSFGIQLGSTGNFNIQTPTPKSDFKAFGYMNNPDRAMYDDAAYQDNDPNNDGYNNGLIMADYSMDKHTDYDKRDYYLGVPQNGADQFMATGEGLSGGFRLYHDKIGTYYPNFVSSKQKIRQIGWEVALGSSIQVGLDVGTGNSKTTMEDWAHPNGLFGNVINICDVDIEGITLGSNALVDLLVPAEIINQGLEIVKNYLRMLKNDRPCGNQFDTADKGYFRFNGDMGGTAEFASDNKTTADVSSILIGSIPGTKSFSPRINDVGLYSNTASKNRSSYINFNLVEDIDEAVEYSQQFEKDSALNALVTETPAKGIDEFEIFNADGMRYVYGLPVYTKNEKSVRLSVTDVQSVENRYIGYQEVFAGSNILDNKTIVGESVPGAYAINHLLTQITTPDYVDIGGNGPDNEDFGGWTKFGYRKWQAVGGNEWYRYRTPYNGFLYNEGSISSKKDDIAMITSGDKEKYYMKCVETKTHVAFFITNKTTASDFQEFNGGAPIEGIDGSQKSRTDGYGAVRETTNSPSKDPAAESKVNDPNQAIEYLEKVVVFAKSRFDKPLSTVYFEYDNNLCKKLPNASSTYASSGKLKLKKVWFESEGVVDARIAPYEFFYTYSTNYSNKIEARYPEIEAHSSALSEANQNPDYSPHTLDSWGNYRYDGQSLSDNRFPWVSQRENDPNFDPAAWNLKRIKLPSGGEIHIQYEQADYSFVQDKDAMVMCALEATSIDTYSSDDNKFYLDMSSIGLDASIPNEFLKIMALKDSLATYYAADTVSNLPGERIYFKFLYALEGGAAPGGDNCRSEYVTGYCTVREVRWDASVNKIFFRLGDDPAWKKSNKKIVPKKICYEYVVSNTHGLLETDNCVSDLPSASTYDDYVMQYYEDGIKDTVEYITKNKTNNHGFTSNFKKDVVHPVLNKTKGKAFKSSPNKNNVCKVVNYPLSYLKIPLFVKSKKGGGIRVKRLLMYDQGIETGDANIYGSEYEYVGLDGRSSGVATNEPGAGREENALVGFMPKKHQGWLGKLLKGRDKEQTEGPMGENLLPAPSIGYSRVVIKNIHSGNTGTGYQVHEFNTVWDYPFAERHTNLKDTRKRDWMNIPLGMINYKVDKWWLAQGYTFMIPDMHGKPKKVATYYGSGTGMVSYTEYEYFEPGSKVKMLEYDPIANKFSYEMKMPGYEQDVTMEQRSVSDRSVDLSLEMDITVAFEQVMPIIYFTFVPSFSYNESEVNTHVTSKVMRYPGILKKTTNYIDGGTVVTENLAFNPSTGEPVLTRTTDGYHDMMVGTTGTNHNGSRYSWTIPSSWVYGELGQMAENSTNRNQLSGTVASITSYGDAGNWLVNNFYNTGLNGIMEWDVDSIPGFGVLAASASQLDNDWFSTAKQEALLGTYNNNVSAAEKVLLNKNYRPVANYVYKADLISANRDLPTDNNRIYDGGVLDKSLVMFDWSASVGKQGDWLLANEVTQYDPNGNPIEEKNILGIYSTAKFGYNHVLPVVVAQNAQYESVFFEHFEEEQAFADLPAHSGLKSLNYRANQDYKFIEANDNIQLTWQLLKQGAAIKLWLKSNKNGEGTFENNSSDVTIVVNNALHVPLEKIAGTGDWTLYSAKIEDWGTISGGSVLSVALEYNLQDGEEVFVDDFRFQPLDAQVSCSVYDIKSFKPVAQFDDQHFGVFFQYNDRGQLVRKMIETERGMKTLQETQYNIPKVERVTP